MSEKHGIEVVPVDSGEACVSEADVVTTITSANEPVLLGQWLRPGTHINAVGATSMNRREIDEEAVGRSTTIIVEHLPQAEAELGELHYAAKMGRFSWDTVRELKDVVGGAMPGRRSDDEITLFDSIGVGAEDVALATYALKKARERSIGIEMPFEPPYVPQRGAS
jgi:ornithine cyclodeaminase